MLEEKGKLSKGYLTQILSYLGFLKEVISMGKAA